MKHISLTICLNFLVPEQIVVTAGVLKPYGTASGHVCPTHVQVHRIKRAYHASALSFVEYGLVLYKIIRAVQDDTE